MAKQRYKKVEAGQFVRELLWSAAFPRDEPRARAAKAKCSTAARQKMNDILSWRKLQMILATNFNHDDLVVTLTYDDGHLPKSREEARRRIKAFLTLLRGQRKSKGEEMRYLYNIESLHSNGRWHHHMVINGTGADYEEIRSLWRYGEDVEIERLDVYGYEGLAKYLTKEATSGQRSVGARSWTASVNLKKPTIYPTQWVPGSMRLEPPANAHILHREGFENEWGRFCYVEYLLPTPPPPTKIRPPKNDRVHPYF